MSATRISDAIRRSEPFTLLVEVEDERLATRANLLGFTAECRFRLGSPRDPDGLEDFEDADITIPWNLTRDCLVTLDQAAVDRIPADAVRFEANLRLAAPGGEMETRAVISGPILP